MLNGGPAASDGFLLPPLRFTGDQLFSVLESMPLSGMPSCNTVTVKYNRPPNHERDSGPGIYACFWDGRLFYVGTFAGNGPDPRKGNVAHERWSKHIAGMTFRGRRLGIAPRWLSKILGEHSGPLVNLLATADNLVLTRDKGLQTQYSKFRFADRHWHDFAKLDNAMLPRFNFMYMRPSLTDEFADMPKAQLDPHLRRMEQEIIEALNPPCNSKSAQINGEPTATLDHAEQQMRAIMSEYLRMTATR